jgi:hypothetical protein
VLEGKLDQAITAKTASYTVASGDLGKLITVDNSAQTYLTIPASLGSNGQIIDVAQLGAGKPELFPAAGVQLRSLSGLRVKGQYGRARAQRIGTDEWQVYGDLETGFSPLDLSPDLWLDASDATTITSSGSPATVSQWNNKGTLSNFTQATGANQPTTGASTVNGLNVFDFDGGDRLSAVNTNEWKFLHDGTEWFFAAVWQAGTTADPNVAYCLFGNNGFSSNTSGAGLFWDDRSSASRNERILPTVSAGAAFAVSGLSEDGFHPANVPVVLTGLVRPSASPAADRSLTQVNAGSTSSPNTSTSAASSSNPTNPLQIGSAGNNLFLLVGKIAELVVVSGANATTTNRQLVRDYLNAKWAVY